MSTAITSATSTNPNQTLSQANFLQLLTTQMADQDPLDPQSDTAFAAQLAQFSALQQSQDMSQSLSSLQANSLIGDSVMVTSADGSTTSTGTVSSVLMNAGVPELMVGGQPYSFSQVTAIAPPTTPASTSPSTTQTTN
jgi:flagellar basal-body rod modification protein FlgD